MDGGVGSIRRHGKGAFENCNLLANMATRYGGGFFVTNYASVEIDVSSHLENNAARQGWQIFNSEGIVHLSCLLGRYNNILRKGK